MIAQLIDICYILVFLLHYITESFEVRTITLEVTEFNTSHTAQAIAEKIQECLRKFGLKEKSLVCILRDGAFLFVMIDS